MLYFAKSMKAMRYVKNCGEFLFEQQFKHEDLIVETLSMEYQMTDVQERQGTLYIPMKSTRPSTKYYGVLIAVISVYPKDIGSVSPVRRNVIAYDEFVFTSNKYDIPLIYVITCLICLGMAGFCYYIISGYLFGKINRFDGLERLSNLRDIDDSSVGYSIMKALEGDFMKELK